MNMRMMFGAALAAAVCFSGLNAESRIAVKVDNISGDYVVVFAAQDMKRQRMDTAIPLDGFMVPQTIKGTSFKIDLGENKSLYTCTKSGCFPVAIKSGAGVYIKVNMQGKLY